LISPQGTTERPQHRKAFHTLKQGKRPASYTPVIPRKGVSHAPHLPTLTSNLLCLCVRATQGHEYIWVGTRQATPPTPFRKGVMKTVPHISTLSAPTLTAHLSCLWVCAVERLGIIGINIQQAETATLTSQGEVGRWVADQPATTQHSMTRHGNRTEQGFLPKHANLFAVLTCPLLLWRTGRRSMSTPTCTTESCHCSRLSRVAAQLQQGRIPLCMQADEALHHLVQRCRQRPSAGFCCCCCCTQTAQAPPAGLQPPSYLHPPFFKPLIVHIYCRAQFVCSRDCFLLFFPFNARKQGCLYHCIA
jgi:hypothetical protein